jgi:large subunit ribosomal protein L25
MEEIRLNVEAREATGKSKLKIVRRQGFIPAVVYGEGKGSLAIQITSKQLLHLLHTHGLENVVVTLQVGNDTKQKNRSCLIKDIQYDPVIGDITHVDFQEISLTKLIKVEVPVVAKGEPVGVKQEGGSLDHIMWKIEIECLPTEIPKEISVDVSNLKIGESVHIKDISFAPSIKVLHEPEAVVLSVSAPVKEEVPVEGAEGEEQKEPEVIKEKKEVPAEEKEETEKKEKK